MQTFKWSDPVDDGYKWCLLCKGHYLYSDYDHIGDQTFIKELEAQGYHLACKNCSTTESV